MIDKTKVVDLVKMRGPTLPVHIRKEINTDVLMASAVLSELVSNKQLNISHTKIGSSPVYYFPGHEFKLQSLYKYLNDKEKRAYDLLKDNKVLRDNKLTPVERVALRNIKDFAKPLNVNSEKGTEIFWKWFLLSNEDAERMVRDILSSDTAENIEQETQPTQPQQAIPAPIQPDTQTTDTLPAKDERVLGEKPSAEALTPPQSPPSSPSLPLLSTKPNIEPPVVAEKEEFVAKPQPEIKPKEEDIKPKEIKKEPVQKELPKSIEEKHTQDKFFNKIKLFFTKNNINLLNYEILRKGSDIDLIVEIISPVGMLRYYCKAKNKKRINDSDLSSAYVKGENHKLPILFITTGDLTKRAKEMFSKEFKNINFKKI